MNDAQALTLAELSVGAYAPIRSAYKMEVGGAILEYLLTDGARITKFRNGFKRAIANAFDEAYAMGFSDGGSSYPEGADPEDIDWLAAAITGEFGFVEMLFQQLKEFKADPETQTGDYQAEADRRAEGYAKTLDGVYNQGLMRARKNVMLTFGGEDGAESCATCQRLKGQRHSVKWWLGRGLSIFRGNRNYECGCWNCQHYFYDDHGKVYTI
jgi:hypothetical protein